MIRLEWHDYSYFPYERDLARREVEAVLGVSDGEFDEEGVRISGTVATSQAERLTYFARFEGGDRSASTTQKRLEEATGSRSRQATRYSAHGLHEYKGKFNPQVAKALLNILGMGKGSRVLDPFCGSGTTLVESAQSGAVGRGMDINPLAVFVANAKLECIRTPVEELRADLDRVVSRLRGGPTSSPRREDARAEYLRSWFDPGPLAEIEAVDSTIEDASVASRAVLLAVASNLLRDYSLQDPADLRIRRRSSPLPTNSFFSAFEEAAVQLLDRVAAAQSVVGVVVGDSGAVLADSRSAREEAAASFDAALTSPPYAMALPYVDTQRLSLVWLGLCEPSGIGPLDGSLIGSREMKKREHDLLLDELATNAREIPYAQHDFCLALARMLGPSDGFRRRAVPALLYRYMSDMRDGFGSVGRLTKPDAPYALIVGHNHTVLSGTRMDIDTPAHLVALAAQMGWRLQECIPLQTYRRYGLHAANAVAAETLLILRNGR